MKNILSIYRNHTKGCKCRPSGNLVSKSLMKIQAHGGANLAPIAVPEICCFILLPNSFSQTLLS